MPPATPTSDQPRRPGPAGPGTPGDGGGLVRDGLRARRFRTSRTVVALMLREMATTYGRSPGGYLWAVVEPILGLAVLTFVFSLMLRSPPVGNSFPLFYATGMLPFLMFNSIANKMATAINFSRPLLAYPAVTLVDALAARFILNALTHLMVAYIVFTGLIAIIGARAELDLPAILLAFAMASVLGIGVGTLNCYLMTAFPVWERAWQIATRPLFIISGIFFTYDSLPRMVQDILWYNPLMHVTGAMRAGFYATYRADYVSLPFVLSVAGLTFVMGLLLLWRHHRELLEN